MKIAQCDIYTQKYNFIDIVNPLRIQRTAGGGRLVVTG